MIPQLKIELLVFQQESGLIKKQNQTIKKIEYLLSLIVLSNLLNTQF